MPPQVFCHFGIVIFQKLEIRLQHFAKVTNMQTVVPAELVNLYQAAVDYQRPYQKLRAAADELGIVPSARRNGLPLYRPDEVRRMNEQCAKDRQPPSAA